MLMGNINFFLFLPKTTLVFYFSNLIRPLSIKLDRKRAWYFPKSEGMNKLILKPIISYREYPKKSPIFLVILRILPLSSTKSI